MSSKSSRNKDPLILLPPMYPYRCWKDLGINFPKHTIF
jgi:hypothetical protein